MPEQTHAAALEFLRSLAPEPAVNTPGIDHRPGKCGDRLCLKGTRLKLSHLLAHLADGWSLTQYAEQFDLKADLCEEALHVAATILNAPADELQRSLAHAESAVGK